MSRFVVNTHRKASYGRFEFRVQWDGQSVPGVAHVSGLRRRTGVRTERDGTAPNLSYRSPGLTEYDPIVLERGRTHDTAFEDWADAVFDLRIQGDGGEIDLKNYRKDVRVELRNAAGQAVLAFDVFECWPSEYVALGELEATARGVATESLTLQHQGWVRDREVTEPAEGGGPTKEDRKD